MKPLTIRLPDELHSEIAEIAKNENRSLNNQIIYLVRRGIAENERPRADIERIRAGQAQIDPVLLGGTQRSRKTSGSRMILEEDRRVTP